MCRSARPGPLAAASILGVEREYKGLYGGGWPLRGMGAAGTALGAADARMNEHYEIGTILTQKSQGVGFVAKHRFHFAVGRPRTHVISSLDFGSRVYLRSQWELARSLAERRLLTERE